MIVYSVFVTVQGWPPPYQRPLGRITWEDSSLEKLLYKFAGRWDSATSNTLHNIYLKPDGSFEDSFEAGYSGQFTDQSGFQTGNWGATGNENIDGRWTIQGNLRQGTIRLIYRNGHSTNYRYQVHCRGSECYGSEYFFNGKLSTVQYIYRENLLSRQGKSYYCELTRNPQPFLLTAIDWISYIPFLC